MKDGHGVHSENIPGTYRPAANKDNDYLIDREAQKRGETYSGVEGIAMQDASLQESMGPIVDRTKERLVSADSGIIKARQKLQRAVEALRDKGITPPGVDPGAPPRPVGGRRAAAGRLVPRGRREDLSGARRRAAVVGMTAPRPTDPRQQLRAGGDRPRRRATASTVRSAGAGRAHHRARRRAPTRSSTDSAPAPGADARFFTLAEPVGDVGDVDPICGAARHRRRAVQLLAELEDADVVIMVATTEADAAAATIIGAACTVRGIMTAGLVIGERTTESVPRWPRCARMRGC